MIRKAEIVCPECGHIGEIWVFGMCGRWFYVCPNWHRMIYTYKVINEKVNVCIEEDEK